MGKQWELIMGNKWEVNLKMKMDFNGRANGFYNENEFENGNEKWVNNGYVNGK